MNINVLMVAIEDLKEKVNEIERKAEITDEDYTHLEKELNSFLSNFSSYKIRYLNNNEELFSGLQYAFNLMKHELKLTSVKKVKPGGFAFPISFSLVSPCNEIYWTDVRNIKPEKKFKPQYMNYLKELNEQRIIETIEELEKKLNNHK